MTNPVAAPRSSLWCTATWSVPLLTQVILGLIVAIVQLLGAWWPGVNGSLLFAFAAAVTLLLTAVLSGLLIRSPSERYRGIALGIMGSYAIVLVGGTLYGLWVIQW
ncbi:hypothetical protein [Mycolicibacterium phlei]